ncbi:hypothetical protein QT952_018785 [Xanthomonas campestris pv. campestris]|uniref:hypothetical protein n=3 Tax=Xanthomonas campestris TaxID=339 RepID=UPI0025A2C168|nr:hypothetical protein [Xanthomonas campestris]MDM7760044.1 hypothetical protein [Xanthomonas campestris pv. campestris]
MTENTRLAHPRTSATPFIIAGAVAVIGAYSLMHLAVQSGSHKTVDASRITQTPRPVEVGHATHAQHAKMNRVEFNDLTNSETGKPFEAGEVQQRLQDFFDRWDSGHAMSLAERDIFMSRLLSTIDSSPEARKAVADYYARIPAKDAANREIVQNMIVRSESGIKMMVDEANRIWKSKDSSL